MVETLRRLGIRAADLAGAGQTASGGGAAGMTLGAHGAGASAAGPPSPRHGLGATGTTITKRGPGAGHRRSASPDASSSPRRDRHAGDDDGLASSSSTMRFGAGALAAAADALSSVDPDALVMLCLQHDEAHIALHNRVEAEEARVAALLRQLQGLNAIATEDAASSSAGGDDSASSSEGAMVRAGSATARPTSASSLASGTVSLAPAGKAAGGAAGSGGWER